MNDDKRLGAEFVAEYEIGVGGLGNNIEGILEELVAYREPSFQQLKSEYASLWLEMSIKRAYLSEVDRIGGEVNANRARYTSVEGATGVPWFVIAAVHNLEASLDFSTHLHNGDPLSARTIHVPAGRPLAGSPPFTWEQSAVDALAYDGLSGNQDWSIEKIAYLLEKYNGWGYRLNHPDVKSPYLWSFSNLYERGKYVNDGQWSPTAVSGECGAMVLLRHLDELGAIQLPKLTVFKERLAPGINQASEQSSKHLKSALDLFEKRSNAIAFSGIKIPDENISGNFLIVDRESCFHSFRVDDLIEEEALGNGQSRVWIRRGAMAWRSCSIPIGTSTSDVRISALVGMEDIPPPPMKEVPGMPQHATEADRHRLSTTMLLANPIASAAAGYNDRCVGGDRYTNNCAHFLSDAFIRSGTGELMQSNSCITARCETSARRVIRARDMWCWFKSKATATTRTLEKNTGVWAVFQLDESVYWGGHVVIIDTDSWTWHGTGCHWNWEQYAYKW